MFAELTHNLLSPQIPIIENVCYGKSDIMYF